MKRLLLTNIKSQPELFHFGQEFFGEPQFEPKAQPTKTNHHNPTAWRKMEISENGTVENSGFSLGI